MPLKWVDSVDYYENELIGVIWDAGDWPGGHTPHIGEGRYGSNCVGVFDHGFLIKNMAAFVYAEQPLSFSAHGDAIWHWYKFGVAVKLPALAQYAFMAFNCGDTTLGLIGVNSLGQISVWQHTDVLNPSSGFAPTAYVSSPLSVQAGVWFYLEISASSVYVSTDLLTTMNVTLNIRLNGVAQGLGGFGLAAGVLDPVISAWGISFGLGGATLLWDDPLIFVPNVDEITADGSYDPLAPFPSPLLDSWLGDCHIDSRMPSGVGNHSDFMPNAIVGNYKNVNERPPDYATTFVSSSTVGAKDSYKYTSLYGVKPTSAATIYGIQHTFFGRAEFDVTGGEVEAATGGSLCRPSSVDFEVDRELPFVWHPIQNIWLENPETTVPWVAADLVNAEFGYELTGVPA